MQKTVALFFIFLISLFSVKVEGGLLYEKHSFSKAKKYAQKFTATGRVVTQRGSTEGFGTGTLINIDDRPAIVTAAHVIQGAQKISFVLHRRKGQVTLSLDIKRAHIYPLYKTLKDKSFDVAIIFLNPQDYKIKGKKIKAPRLWQSPLYLKYMTLFPRDYEDVDPTLVSFVGYGMNGTFNDKGHVAYKEGYQQKIAAKLIATPKKNISHVHGCGFEGGSNLTNDQIIEISQKHYFWDREKKLNSPAETLEGVNLRGAFSPGDSGGPLIYKKRIIGVIATAELPLIKLCAKDFYKFVPQEVRSSWMAWDQKFSRGSFMQNLLRKLAQAWYDIPDSTVNLYQTATAITPTIYNWMRDQ